MMRSDMMWSPTIRNARVTAQASAADAPTRGLWGRIVRMAAVAGTCAMVLFGLGIGAAAGAEKAPSSGYSEYKVKAAFLYNFAKFTKWPSEAYANASAPLTVCVLGKDAFGKALDALVGKRINGRPVAVSRLAGVEEACPAASSESWRHNNFLTEFGFELHLTRDSGARPRTVVQRPVAKRALQPGLGHLPWEPSE